MIENFYFGGGAAQSTMHPAVLALTLLVVFLVFVLPREHLFPPIAVAAFLTPFGAQLFLGGFHFFVMRIIIVAGLIRLTVTRLSAGRWLVFSGGFTTFDKIFCAWAFFRGAAFILLHRESGAVINQAAFWWDAYGAYFLFRFMIRSESDIDRVMRTIALIVAVLAVCTTYEYLSGTNPFSFISTSPIVPALRGGRVRANGSFAHAITAGSFGATALPLLFWLFKRKGAKTFAIVGLAAATVVTLTSTSSTPVSAYLTGIVSLSLWPIRNHMRVIRWAVASAFAALALVMKAPIWYLLQRVDFVGGHGWDRAFLVDQFVRNYAQWWLVGTDQNADWGFGTWDRCNQYVAEGVSGGLVTFALFIAILAYGLSIAGRARLQSGRTDSRWLFWCLGSALFAHMVAFQGVSYFDQLRVWWFAMLAIIALAAATLREARTTHIDKKATLQAETAAPAISISVRL